MEPFEKHGSDELQDAPLLKGLGKPSLWEVPDGYFDQFPQAMKERLEEENLLSNSPMLHAAAQKASLPETPEGYFDTLSSRVMAQLATSPEGDATIKPLWQRLRQPVWGIAAAAALALILTVGWLLQNPSLTPTPTEITTEDLIAFAEQGEIDMYALSSELDLSFIDLEKSGGITEEDMEELLEDLDLGDIPLDEVFIEGI